jgi:tetratricopeptide (TPR) repeat protein
VDQDHLSLALELHQAGKLREAKAQCQEMLRQCPTHPAAWNLLGFLEHQEGNGEKSIRAFQSAISAKPDFADAHFNLGNIFRSHGKPREAETAYRACLALNPNDAAVNMSLGAVLQEQGEHANAATAFRAALELAPDDADAHFHLATALMFMGELEAALESFHHTLRRRPNNIDAQTNLGYTLKRLGRYEEAAQVLRAALECNPNSAESHNNLGAVLRDLRQFEAAAAAFREALKLKPDFMEAQNNLGQALFDLGELEAAIEAFKRALEIHPEDLNSYINLAGLGERANRLDVSKAAIESGLKLSPEDPSLHLLAAKCERREGQIDSAIARLERIDRSNAREIIAIDIAFELGQLYERSDDAGRAFSYFSEGNRLARQYPAHRKVDKREFLGLIDSLSRCLTEDWLASWSETPPHSSNRTPAFIVGFPRSGTTLIEQILGAHPKLQTLDEKPTLDTMLARLPNYPDALARLSSDQFDELRGVYFAAVAEFVDIGRDTRIVDKMPLNIIHAVSIQRFFPAAKIILVVRHPCDVCLSCFMQNFVVNSSMANFFSLEDAARLYAKVMRLWQNSTKLLPLDYHIVRYEDLVGDFEAETRRMLKFLGLDWDPAVEDHAQHAKRRGKILTPSYHQVTQPIYQRAIYRWQRYQDKFGGVKAILEPFVRHFGYSWNQ